MRNKNGCVDEENEEFYMNLGNNFYLQLQTNLFFNSSYHVTIFLVVSCR